MLVPNESNEVPVVNVLVVNKNVNEGIASNITKDTAATAIDTSTTVTNTTAAAAAAAAAASTKERAGWEEVKKARNRINSQRTRERERSSIKSLEVERSRLWLSNDAIKFQNQHYRDTIARILEVRDMNQNGGAGNSNDVNGVDEGLLTTSSPATTCVMGLDSLGTHAAHGGLFGSSRLSLQTSAVPNFDGLSDADLLARHQATTLKMQNMMRQQGAMGGNIGGAAGLNMNNIGMCGRMGTNSSTGMNMNNMNGMNSPRGLGVGVGVGIGAPLSAPYSDLSDNIRIRQLMLQHSATAGDFEPKGLLSSIGGAPGLSQTNMTGGATTINSELLEDTNGIFNGIGVNFGGTGGLGENTNGLSDADIFQMNKQQKYGF